MKNITTIVIISLTVLFASCTKDISKDNINPKAPATAPSAAVFTAGQKAFVDAYTSTSVSSAPFRVLAQAWTENTYTYEARYDFSAYQTNNGWWNALYLGDMGNLSSAKALFPTDVAAAATLKNDRIIADLLIIYSYHTLVTTYGNVPYTQAENNVIPFPKYDDAKTVYYDLLTRLDTCIAGLNTSATSLGNADEIYKGSAAKWLKFAATLKLKMSMVIADIDAATASKKVNEAIATGVFGANTDNATMTYDASATGTSNPIWQALVQSGRHDFAPAAFLVNTMKSLNDPRIPLYFTTDPNGNYTGGTAGNGNSYSTLSKFSATWLGATYPGDVLDYAETEFLLAEAAERGFIAGGSATAATHYNNAVTASITFWGGTAAQATTYLAQPSVAYATAAGNYKQKIGYQKWIAFANRNYDAWLEVRRLGYPNLDVVSPPTAATTTLPLRLPYPYAEQTSNPTNWAAGAAALPGGKDVQTAKLFFMP